MKMKALLLVLGLSVLASAPGFAAEGWETDFEKAAARAKKEKKPMLLDFTGSDWCGWCIKLDKEVFTQQAFKDYATNLVLVMVDFPRKTEQSAELKKQNEKLGEKFNVEGYPTVILLGSDGKKVLGTTGYQKGGPDAYVEHLQELIGGPKAKKKKK